MSGDAVLLSSMFWALLLMAVAVVKLARKKP